MGDSRYLLDNSRGEAGERFVAMAALLNPATFRHLGSLGVGPGMRCWDVGAGSAPVPLWLAGRVGASGYVLATDLDVRYLDAASAAGVEVRRHDVVADEPPGTFDLIHARAVLAHLPEREAVLRRLVDALNPGGWLLVEDPDSGLQPLACLDPQTPEEELANRIRLGFRALFADRGGSRDYARTLPRLFRAAGLTSVGAEAYTPIGGPDNDRLEAATVRHIRDQLIAAGHATAEEIDQHLADVEGGRFDLAIALVVSAWGQKPA